MKLTTAQVVRLWSMLGTLGLALIVACVTAADIESLNVTSAQDALGWVIIFVLATIVLGLITAYRLVHPKIVRGS